jgi:hypothetical protein
VGFCFFLSGKGSVILNGCGWQKIIQSNGKVCWRLVRLSISSTESRRSIYFFLASLKRFQGDVY